MRKALPLLILLLSSLYVQAQQPEPQTRPAKKNIHPYAGPHIQVKGQALFFNSYQQWLQQVYKRTKKHVAVDKFQRQNDPKLYKRLSKNTDSYWMEYESDGLTISGVLAYPKHSKLDKLPVVIYNRGGNAKTAANNRWAQLRKILPLAEQGYLVLASNYRGSKFSQGKDEYGGKDVNDVLRLLELVETIPKADPQRIGMMGWSRGAMMSMQAAKQSTKVKALIAVAGVYDQAAELQFRPEMEQLMLAYIPGFEQNKQQELVKRSAVYWADKLNKNMPILLMHGTQDWRVEFSQSQGFANKLQQLGHPYQLQGFEDGDHALTFYQQEWQQTAFAFLKQNL